MAKLNKELQENLKEINKIVFKMAEIDNDFIISMNIHNEMIVVRINSVKFIKYSKYKKYYSI